MIKVKINPEKGNREHDLAHQFQITGFPTVFRIDEGEPRRIAIYSTIEDFSAAFDGRPTSNAIESGYSLLEHGKAAEAGNQFDRAMRSDPKNPELHVMKGVALYEQGHRVEAEYEFQAANHIKPQPAAYDYLANIALDKRQWSDALQYSNQLIALDPNYGHGHGYYLRALAYWDLGETYEAYNDADRACSMGHQEACTIRQKLRQAR